ncbi:MAG: RluA family pseudouridine synthase [Synergistaceae bacterium]|jgi:23S rRNA pseudouridine955/2504/2580 synthase|nr:RluA family pseudouridine synthase [Synergistaceae bacterium]
MTTPAASDSGGVFEATKDQADRRLDRVLRGMFRDVPLGAIMKGLRNGSVRVNGNKTSPDARLLEYDVVTYPWVSACALEKRLRTNEAKFPREHEKLVTLFKNDDLWCVDKPAGLLSQPDRAEGDSIVTRAWAELGRGGWDFRPALIGRLDRNVSGVSAIALSAMALRSLSEAVRRSLVEKIYVAVVSGVVPKEGDISLPLVKDSEKNFVRPAAPGEKGMDARTKFRLLESRGKISLVEVELVTGRPHQVRVHLASIGHPILGDTKYGPRAARQSGLMLHSHRMSFPDMPEFPEALRGLVVISPIPQSFWGYCV